MFRKRHGVTHPDLALAFAVDNLANSATDVALAALLTSTKFVFPFGGWIVGLGINLSAAIVSGVLSYDIVIGTTQQEINTVQDVAATYHNWIAPKEYYRFNAGDKLGVSYTSGTLGVATVDATALLLVVLDMR